MNAAVSNASPLIILAKADLLEILPKLFSTIFLPRAVRAEIEVGEVGDPMREKLGRCPWLVEMELSPPLSPLSHWQLGPGESEVIEYARLHQEVLALLDDRAARRAAEALGVKVRGTLSVVAMATRHGHIPSFPAAAEQLQAAGLYVSDDLVASVVSRLRQERSE